MTGVTRRGPGVLGMRSRDENNQGNCTSSRETGTHMDPSCADAYRARRVYPRQSWMRKPQALEVEARADCRAAQGETLEQLAIIVLVVEMAIDEQQIAPFE